ncbi:MAG: hypothetical protein DRP08_02525, partial [Candidatus Aenigmatarchaeota archaeon]
CIYLIILFNSYSRSLTLLSGSKDVGIWIKKNLPPRPIIMSRYSHVPFYADGVFVPMPYANYSAVIDYARYKNVDYIIINRDVISIRRPELAFLINETSAAPELKLIFEYNDGKENILVYELVDKSYTVR